MPCETCGRPLRAGMAIIQVLAREVSVPGESVVARDPQRPSPFILCNRCGADLTLAIQRLRKRGEAERSP